MPVRDKNDAGADRAHGGGTGGRGAGGGDRLLLRGPSGARAGAKGRQRVRVHTRAGPEAQQVRELSGGERQPGGGRREEHQGRFQVDRQQPGGLLVAPERAERALCSDRQHRPRNDPVRETVRGRAERGD